MIYEFLPNNTLLPPFVIFCCCGSIVPAKPFPHIHPDDVRHTCSIGPKLHILNKQIGQELWDTLYVKIYPLYAATHTKVHNHNHNKDFYGVKI